MAELTPMMRQYMSVKEANGDCILFYRLGDFYEMFFDDAKIASKELELVLTGRDCGQEERAPMCGVPYHSCEAYIARLVSRGYKVAVCEQLTDPALSKGLVERDVVRIITPGTITESSMLEERINNYLMAVCLRDDEAGLAFADVSTGEFYVTLLSGDDIAGKIINEAGRYSPREALLNTAAAMNGALCAELGSRLATSVTQAGGEDFDEKNAQALIDGRFGEGYCDKIGLNGAVTAAAGALYAYLVRTQKSELPAIGGISFYGAERFMRLDLGTRRNLELCQTLRRGEKKGALLWAIDETKTPMGGRMLRAWLEKPLCDIAAILSRQGAVKALFEDNMRRDALSQALKDICDFERILTRVSIKTANCRDLKALERGIRALPAARAALKGTQSALLARLHEEIDELSDVAALIETAIAKDPPLTLREGGIIEDGFDPRIDELRALVKDSKAVLAGIEAQQREKTGIKNLKIGFNKVFGYYLEVTNSYAGLVPAEYIRKQTLANCERYITEELKELEQKILSAGEKVTALEYEVFCAVRETIEAAAPRIRKTAASIAQADALFSLAETAKKNRYVCPEMNLEGRVNIKSGRHPVVELMLKDGMFVPNDTLLDGEDNRAAIITGPNMAGKSTYMRQVALIVIMAQIGGFVPAASADLPVADAVFTRVGASDDLSAGQSTFMVEMSEVAYILKNATRDSLLIFDEIGRGTSTYDGMSIARAVLEYSASKKTLGAKTMFATHYHELTELEGLVEGVKNYNITVKKRGDDITFLRRIVRGGADDSYGIEVAKLAGVPDAVTDRAKAVLKEIENKPYVQKAAEQPPEEDGQLSLGGAAQAEIIEKLKSISIETLTPIECMNILFEIKKRAESL